MVFFDGKNLNELFYQLLKGIGKLIKLYLDLFFSLQTVFRGPLISILRKHSVP